MKVLGVDQFHKKKYKIMPYDGRHIGALGRIPYNFVMVIYGESGNGKTECAVQLAKDLTPHGKAAWLSYEQGHGFDLHTASSRNKMEEVSGKFMVIDPNEGRKPGKTFLQELDEYLSKRGSPRFIFIDSLDYTRFTWEDYVYLKEKYGKTKSFIFIAHATGSKPKLRITEQIYYDGGIAWLVKNYMIWPKKNRFGGFEPSPVWEQKARELNPKYFNE